MPEENNKINKVHRFQSLSNYSFKERFIIKTADLLFYTLIALIGKTLRYEVEGAEFWEAAESNGKLPIYTMWHDRIFALTYFLRNRRIAVMTSQSFDGEYIARFIQRFGFKPVRGSSTRGAVGALAEMIRLMKKGTPMALTIDGPKGPRHEAKLGVCMLAKKTGNPIMPIISEPQKFWQLNSWDKLQIPKPFTRTKVFIDKLIFVSPAADEEELENKRRELQNSLDELVRCGVQWRESKD